MRLPTALACILSTCLAAADPITGCPTPQGGLMLLDAGGPLLEVAPIAWGPKWGWTGLKTDLSERDGGTSAALSGTLGNGGPPIRIALEARRSGARQLTIDASLTAERDGGSTLVVLALSPGKRYAQATVTEAGAPVARAVPFGREALGNAVSALRLGDGEGALSIASANAVEIQADGAARLVLGKEQLTGGATRTVHLVIDLPGDLTWYPTPAAVPAPAGFEGWFAWKPESAHDDQGALGMKDWMTPITESVTDTGDHLQVGGKPATFWGLNVCYSSCAPAKDLAERRAKMYAKYGVNAVRLHKYADGPGWAGIQSENSFAEFDAAALDRMDYFVAKLKEQGIRVKLSPTFGIQMGAGDRAAVPYLDEFGKLGNGKGARVRAAHGAVWLGHELQDLQIRQTVGLLKHVNPYTGLSYAADPAVLVVEMYNEDSALFFGTMGMLQKSATLRKQAGEAFGDWLRARYTDEAGLTRAWGAGAVGSFVAEGFKDESWAARTIVPAGNPWFYDPEQLAGSQAPKAQRLHDTMLFLYERQNAFWDRFQAAMREAGYKGEVLASNWIAGRGFSHLYNLHSDARIGIVDRHNYFGGPGSMLEQAGKGILSIGMCQVANRPFSVSEWITTRPNEWAAEGPAIIGAYGMGLQGWDVSFAFQNGDDGRYSDRIGRDEWDVVSPLFLGMFPAVSRQVLRGDVAESKLQAPLRVHVPSLRAGKLGFDDRSTAQGDVKTSTTTTVPAAALAVARVAVEFTDSQQETPAFHLAAHRTDGALVSSTGQLRWYEGTTATSGLFTIDTAATKAVVGFAGGRTFQLGGATIAAQTPFAAIYLTALGRDDHDLATAPRILVTAVARAWNTGMRMLDGRVLVAGAAPILMEPVKARITLPGSRKLTVTALDHDGRRTATTVPVEGSTFTIDGASAKTIHWEVVAE